MRFVVIILISAVAHVALAQVLPPADASGSPTSEIAVQNGLLDLLAEIEQHDAALRAEGGKVPTISNLVARDNAIIAWMAIGTHSPLKWWQPTNLPTPPFINKFEDANNILHRITVYGVAVYPQTDSENQALAERINAALELAVKQASDEARKGIENKEDADKAAAAAEASVRKDAADNSEHLKTMAGTLAAFPEIEQVNISTEGRWLDVVKRFQQPSPDWEAFAVRDRKGVLDDYLFTVTDLERELAWPYYFEIDRKLTALENHKLLVSEKVAQSNTATGSVASTWNTLIDTLTKRPLERPGPPPSENAPEPKPLPPYTSDEIAEQVGNIVDRLSVQIAALAGNGESISTELDRIANLLIHLQRYRHAIATAELVGRKAANIKNSSDLIALHTAFSGLNAAAAVEDVDAAKKQLDEQWRLIQQEVAACATLKARLDECETVRDEALSTLEQAIRNNRPALLENASFQIGVRIRNTIGAWDQFNNQRLVDWNQPQELELRKRDDARTKLALRLNEIHSAPVTKEVPRERLLRQRSIKKGELQPSAAALETLVKAIGEENGGQVPDEELHLVAIAHRVVLEGSWHLRIEKKEVRRLVLYCHEVQFAPNTYFELDEQCEVDLITNRLIGSPPTLILKDKSLFNVFISDRVVGARPSRVLGSGTLEILTGGRTGHGGGVPQAAWQWLAGDLKVMRKTMTEYWQGVWSYYLKNDLDATMPDSDRRVVYVELTGLPKTAFMDVDKTDELSNSLSQLEEQLAVGSIEHVLDSISKRRIPVFIDKAFTSGSPKTVYQLPDEIVIHRDGDHFGEWLPDKSEDGKRRLRVTIQARSSVFGSQRAKEVLKQKFGQNIRIVPIEDDTTLRLVFEAENDYLTISTPDQAATDESNVAEFASMRQVDLISNWKRWSTGNLPEVNLAIERKTDGEFAKIAGHPFYTLPIEFGRTIPEPEIAKTVANGRLIISNTSGHPIKLEYGILETNADFFDLRNVADLSQADEFKTPIPAHQTDDVKVALIRDLGSEGPLDLFALRRAFPDVQHYSIDLAGLEGARFPNKALQPGFGPAMDHAKSTIRFRTKPKNAVRNLADDPMYFRGTVLSYVSRGRDGRAETKYVVIAASDSVVELVINCVPRFGSSFVEPDEEYEVVYRLTESDRDREILTNLTRLEFQRRLSQAVKKRGLN